MRRISPYPLWIGHDGDGRDFPRLHEAGVRALVPLAIEEPLVQPPRDLAYLRSPLSDGAGRPAIRGLFRNSHEGVRAIGDRSP